MENRPIVAAIITIFVFIGCKHQGNDSGSSLQFELSKEETKTFSNELTSKGKNMLLTVQGTLSEPTWAGTRYLKTPCRFDHGGFYVYEKDQILQLISVAKRAGTIIHIVPDGVKLYSNLYDDAPTIWENTDRVRDSYQARALTLENNCGEVLDVFGRPINTK